MSKASRLLVSSFALAMGCAQGSAAVLISEPVNGAAPAEELFATIGLSIRDDLLFPGHVSAILIASDVPDLCEQMGSDGTPLLRSILAGRFPGTFVVSTFSQGHGPAAELEGATFQSGRDEVLTSTAFIVSNGASADVLAFSEGLGDAVTFERVRGDNFTGSFTGALALDFSGRDPFDIDIDGDDLPDATRIQAGLDGTFSGVGSCLALENAAFNGVGFTLP
jgi:hypothetical protein